MKDAGAPIEERDPRFAAIDALVSPALLEGKTPGCVVLVGRHDEILFERAWGDRSIVPTKEPMTIDTVFDLASLTKPLATASSVMVLVERGLVDLDKPAARWVPELAKLPPFTVRQLLLHTSGLPAGTAVSDYAQDRSAMMARIGRLALKTQPGEAFVYSDVGFIVLEEIVRRVSKKDLAAFAADEVFAPLGMKETGFLPPPELRARAALTEARDGGFVAGDVHDPRAFAMGGVAGHAGVFSTGRDLARYAQAMLSRGTLDGQRVFSEKTFARFIERHETPKGGRALGWDVDSSFATHRSSLLSTAAFGHGGYTGTAMWIDPNKDLFVVFLSNRVHPEGKGAVNPLVAEIVSAAVNAMETKTGIDVLRAESFARLKGSRIGLITNASAKARDGATTIDALRTATEVKLVAIFSPEHGLSADKEGPIADATYAGIPLHSLYGERFSPTATSLDGIDTIVFDLQDAGMRFYTYASTMKRAMKVAAERNLRFVVLDRPNPINGADVSGPMLEASDLKGFVNHHALPLRHGMTMGELARLFASDDKIDVRLDVVPMTSWRRKDWFDRTGLTWNAPSPNLKNMRGVVLYPAIGLLEATNVSVGRGTDAPFELVGAPWMDGKALAEKLNALSIGGVSFEAIEFSPRSAVHANKKCGGIRVKVTDRNAFEPITTGLRIAAALHELHPNDWDFESLDKMLKHKPAMEALRAQKSIVEVEGTWAEDLAAFKKKREAFLLYH